MSTQDRKRAGAGKDQDLTALENLLGPQGLIRDAAACRAAGLDWRGAYQGPVLALARPASTAQAAAIVAWARQTHTALVPQGGNSSLCGGAVPAAHLPPALILSASRLRQIRKLDRHQGLLIAEAGLVLEELQNKVSPLRMPIDLGGRGSAQLGGLLACHAGGLNVVRYGSLRAHVRGLEAILPSGEIWHGLSEVKKDNSGYDLKSLLIGSEGTLGFITAAALDLHAPPHDTLTALVPLETPTQALDLYYALRDQFAGQIYAVELMSQAALRPAVAHHTVRQDPFGGTLPAYALLLEIGLHKGLADQETALAQTLLSSMSAPPLLAQSPSQQQAFWSLREAVVLAQRDQGPSLKHDLCVPLAQVPALLDQGQQLAQHIIPGCLPAPFGHLGDGSFHFNITCPEGFGTKTQALTRALHDLVHDLGGSISAEHGLGQLRRAEAARLRDPAASRAMQAIKQALDPQGLFNPEKMI